MSNKTFTQVQIPKQYFQYNLNDHKPSHISLNTSDEAHHGQIWCVLRRKPTSLRGPSQFNMTSCSSLLLNWFLLFFGGGTLYLWCVHDDDKDATGNFISFTLKWKLLSLKVEVDRQRDILIVSTWNGFKYSKVKYFNWNNKWNWTSWDVYLFVCIHFTIYTCKFIFKGYTLSYDWDLRPKNLYKFKNVMSLNQCGFYCML